MSDFQLVRYNLGKKTFEIMVKPKTVPLYREGKISSLDDVLMSFEVFRDFNKREVASTQDLSEFQLKDNTEILKKILKDGEYQLSTQERREMTEKKRREIIQFIHKNYVDPKTGYPHPPDRIENAMANIHFTIDYKQAADAQVKLLVPKLLGQIALRKSTMECDLEIPHSFFGKAAGVIQKHGKTLQQNYSQDGVQLLVEVVPGEFDPLIKQLNEITKGYFKFQIRGAVATTSEPPETDSKKGGKKKKHGKK